MDGLREQLMVNKFVMVTGCHAEQARQLLISAKWHFEAALSMFFQDSTVAHAHIQCCNCSGNSAGGCHFPMCTPANTPVTPPNLPDTLLAFSRLSTASSATLSVTDPNRLMSCSSTFGSSTSQSQVVAPMYVQTKVNSGPNSQEQWTVEGMFWDHLLSRWILLFWRFCLNCDAVGVNRGIFTTRIVPFYYQFPRQQIILRVSQLFDWHACLSVGHFEFFKLLQIHNHENSSTLYEQMGPLYCCIFCLSIVLALER